MRRFYADIILKNTFYDVAQMIERKEDHKNVMKILKAKIRYLEKTSKWYRIAWWDETRGTRHNYERKTREETDNEELSLLTDTFLCIGCENITPEIDRSLFSDKNYCNTCKPNI